MKAGKSRLDITLNILCLAVLIGVSVYLAVTWRRIPELVPMHYNSAGVIDRFGSKKGLIALSIIPWAVYIIFTAVQFIPKSMWNTGFAVTDEDRERVYALSVHCLNSVKLMIILLMSYCNLTSAAGVGFSGWCVFALIAAALGTLFYWIGRTVRVGTK